MSAVTNIAPLSGGSGCTQSTITASGPANLFATGFNLLMITFQNATYSLQNQQQQQSFFFSNFPITFSNGDLGLPILGSDGLQYVAEFPVSVLNFPNSSANSAQSQINSVQICPAPPTVTQTIPMSAFMTPQYTYTLGGNSLPVPLTSATLMNQMTSNNQLMNCSFGTFQSFPSMGIFAMTLNAPIGGNSGPSSLNIPNTTPLMPVTDQNGNLMGYQFSAASAPNLSFQILPNFQNAPGPVPLMACVVGADSSAFAASSSLPGGIANLSLASSPSTFQSAQTTSFNNPMTTPMMMPASNFNNAQTTQMIPVTATVSLGPAGANNIITFNGNQYNPALYSSGSNGINPNTGVRYVSINPNNPNAATVELPTFSNGTTVTLQNVPTTPLQRGITQTVQGYANGPVPNQTSTNQITQMSSNSSTNQISQGQTITLPALKGANNHVYVQVLINPNDPTSLVFFDLTASANATQPALQFTPVATTATTTGSASVMSFHNPISNITVQANFQLVPITPNTTAASSATTINNPNNSSTVSVQSTQASNGDTLLQDPANALFWYDVTISKWSTITSAGQTGYLNPKTGQVWIPMSTTATTTTPPPPTTTTNPPASTTIPISSTKPTSSSSSPTPSTAQIVMVPAFNASNGHLFIQNPTSLFFIDMTGAVQSGQYVAITTPSIGSSGSNTGTNQAYQLASSPTQTLVPNFQNQPIAPAAAPTVTTPAAGSVPQTVQVMKAPNGDVLLQDPNNVNQWFDVTLMKWATAKNMSGQMGYVNPNNGMLLIPASMMTAVASPSPQISNPKTWNTTYWIVFALLLAVIVALIAWIIRGTIRRKKEVQTKELENTDMLTKIYKENLIKSPPQSSIP